VRIVDPPEGWRYGFPARLEDDYAGQLRRAGYPEKNITMALNHSRFWDEAEDELEAINGRLA
jgi:hypothetical protein